MAKPKDRAAAVARKLVRVVVSEHYINRGKRDVLICGWKWKQLLHPDDAKWMCAAAQDGVANQLRHAGIR